MPTKNGTAGPLVFCDCSGCRVGCKAKLGFAICIEAWLFTTEWEAGGHLETVALKDPSGWNTSNFLH